MKKEEYNIIEKIEERFNLVLDSIDIMKAGMQGHIKELKEKVIKELNSAVEKFIRFKPKDGQIFFCINSLLNYNDHQWDNDNLDNKLYENFNCFETELECQQMSLLVQNYFKVMYYLKAVNGDWKPNWCDCKVVKNCISVQNCKVENCVRHKTTTPLSFKSQEARDDFRKFVSDEEIKLFLNPMQGV